MRKEQDWFEAMFISGNGKLAANEGSLEAMKATIDKTNAHCIATGWNPSKYMIVHVEYYKWLDDDGLFVKSEEYRSRVEIYPETLGGGEQ